MATGRALTTEYERECLRGAHGDQRRYEAKSRVQARIRDRLSQDIELFASEEPDLLDLLQEVACDDGDD